MATATVTAVTGLSGIKPTTGYRITGGSKTDRLSIDDIVTAATDLQISATRILTQVGTSAATFLFGGAAAALSLASGSTKTVLQFAGSTDLSDYAAGDEIVVGDEAAEIASVNDSSDTITLTTATALDAAPASGTAVSPPKDTYLDFSNFTIRLVSNSGLSDSSANDLGNGTSKVVFTDQCDMAVGRELGDLAINPGLAIESAHFSHDYYNYVLMFEPYAKLVCTGLLLLRLKGNSRVALGNRHPASEFRTAILVHSAGGFLENAGDYSLRPGINVDLATKVASMYFTQRTLQLREYAFGGTIYGASISVPLWTVENGELTEFYWNVLSDIGNVYEMQDVTPRQEGSTTKPRFKFNHTGGSAQVTVTMRRWGGVRATSGFQVENSAGDLLAHLGEDVAFKIVDAAGADQSADVDVEADSYVPTFGGQNVIPTAAVTDYGTKTEHDAVSEFTQAMISHSIAAARVGNTTARDLDDAFPVAILTARSKARYSIWAFGKAIVYRQTFTLGGDETGRQAVNAQLSDDEHVTAASASAVATAADDLDDVYDILHKHAVANKLDNLVDVDGTELDFGSLDLTLASGGSLSVSATSITIPCGAELGVGAKFSGLKTTGTVTVSGITVTAPYVDTDGIRVIITGLPAGHEAVAAAWPKSQGKTVRTNVITGEAASSSSTLIQLTLAVDTEYYVIADAVSYLRSAETTIDTGSRTSLSIPLTKITDIQGNDLVEHDYDNLSTGEKSQADLVTWAADYIDVSASSVLSALEFDALSHKVEVGQSTAGAQSALLYPARISSGRIIIPSSSSQKWRRKTGLATTIVPDLSDIQIGKDGTDLATDFISFVNGAIAYKAQAPVFPSINIEDAVDDATKENAKVAAAVLAGNMSTETIAAGERATFKKVGTAVDAVRVTVTDTGRQDSETL